MFHEVWKQLPSDFRADLLKRCVEWWREDEGGVPIQVANLVAKVTHSREKTVLGQIRRGDVPGLRLAVSKYPDHMVHAISSTLTAHFPKELEEVHRALGTEFDAETGRPVVGYGDKAPAIADVKRLLEGDGGPALGPFVRLIMGITAEIGTDAWRPVARQALLECPISVPSGFDLPREAGDSRNEKAEPAGNRAPAPNSPERRAMSAVGTPEESEAREAAEEEEEEDTWEEEEDEAHAAGESPKVATPPSPTNVSELDRVLIDAAVQAANGATGARSLEQIAAIVEELVRLNDKRFPSQALVGFVDALMGREIRPRLPGGNVIRRIWYLKGFLEGHRRTDSDAAFVARVKALAAEDVAAFETAMQDFPREVLVARVAVADMVIRAAIAMDDAELVQSWFSFRDSPALIEPVLAGIARSVRKGEPKKALPLLRHIRQQIKDIQRTRGLPGYDESRDFTSVFDVSVVGLEATALRLCGRFDDAIQRLERLKASIEEQEFRAPLWGGLALAKLRIVRIEEVPLKGTGLDSLIRRIAAVEPLLLKAEQEGQGHAPSLFLLALPTVFRKNSTRAERAKALERLRKASGLLSSLEIDLAQGPFPAIVEAMAAILELQDGESEQVGASAAASLLRALEAGLRLEPALVREAGEYAIALGAPEAEAILRHSFALGASLDEALPVEELVAKTPVIASALLDQSDQRAMTPGERSRLEVRILRGLARNADPSLEIRERCADRLEVRASSDRVARKVLVDLLEAKDSDERCWQLTWQESDRDAILVRSHLEDGNRERVGELLGFIGYAALKASRGLLAQDCADQLKELGIPNALEDSLRASRPAPPKPIAGDRPKIALVGGNEIQGQYETRLLEWFTKQWPGGRLKIWRPGWGANWASEISDLDRNLANYHAVVILTFVRTNLGRHLRRRVNDEGLQWFSCTGHGYESLRRSVEHAVVETAGRRKSIGS
jgi:hypothetical protein